MHGVGAGASVPRIGYTLKLVAIHRGYVNSAKREPVTSMAPVHAVFRCICMHTIGAVCMRN
jgi:hypothetical protein